MPAYVCTLCGESVWAEPGREIRSAAAHAKEAGHANVGLTHANTRHAPRIRPAAPGFAAQPSRSSLRARWDGLRLSTRGAIAVGLFALAAIAGVQLADDEPPPRTGCHGGFPVRAC
ncbi:hypothetical protein [Streptomyces sp. NPDC055287]